MDEFKIGDEILISAYVFVTNVHSEYLEIETDGGETFTIVRADWSLERA